MAAAGLIVASGAGVAYAGTALGTVLQGQFEAGPTADETRAFERLGAPQDPGADPDAVRGPNRADLGGGR